MADANPLYLTEGQAARISRGLQWIDHFARPHDRIRRKQLYRQTLPLKRFELDDALNPGSFETTDTTWADAYEVFHSTDGYERSTDHALVVYDTYGMFEGRGYSTSRRGSRGVAAYYSDSQRWEIVYLEPHVVHYWTSINSSDGLEGGATATVSGSPTNLWPEHGIWLSTDGNAPTTVQNPFGLYVDDGDTVFVVWSPAHDQYSIVQGTCPG